LSSISSKLMVFEALPISAKKHAPKARGEIGD